MSFLKYLSTLIIIIHYSIIFTPLFFIVVTLLSINLTMFIITIITTKITLFIFLTNPYNLNHFTLFLFLFLLSAL